jgi:hypothetical protein
VRYFKDFLGGVAALCVVAVAGTLMAVAWDLKDCGPDHGCSWPSDAAMWFFGAPLVGMILILGLWKLLGRDQE